MFLFLTAIPFPFYCYHCHTLFPSKKINDSKYMYVSSSINNSRSRKRARSRQADCIINLQSGLHPLRSQEEHIPE